MSRERAVTDDEAVREGLAAGRVAALRSMLRDPSVLDEYASGEAGRRKIGNKARTIAAIVARQMTEVFGSRDSRLREHKYDLFVSAYVDGALGEMAEECARRGIAVAE